MTLISMAPREALIEQITDARVLQRYGDLNNAAELERAVDIALHNQMRTRMVATELAALEASTTPGRRDALRRAAREFAERVVQRKKIRDLRPSQFAAAEAQAAREAQRALAAGNNRLAAARKRDQLFNGYASRAASRAQDSIEKGLRYLNSFNNPGTRKTSIRRTAIRSTVAGALRPCAQPARNRQPHIARELDQGAAGTRQRACDP